MNVVIFSLTILAMYGIIAYAYKAWKRAEVEDKMEEIEEIEHQHAEILAFKKVHKGDVKKKRKTIKDFTNK